MRSIDCRGPVVSQRLSPLTNPLARCHPARLIDCNSPGRCNYTRIQRVIYFSTFTIYQKISFIFGAQRSLLLRKQKRTHKIPLRRTGGAGGGRALPSLRPHLLFGIKFTFSFPTERGRRSASSRRLRY